MERPHNFPSDTYQAIEEELRTYRDPNSFKQFLDGLRELYDKTPFSTALSKYAANVAITLPNTVHVKNSFTSAEMVYQGGLFALHADINLFPSLAADLKSHQFDVAPYRYDGEGRDAYDVRCLEAYKDDVEEIDRIFESLTDMQQDAILMSAVRASKPYGDKYAECFTIGVVKSLHELL